MSDIYRKLDEVFLELTQALSIYSKSKFLQDYFITSYISFIYANIIKNFFINLTRETIKKLNLPKSQIGEIKKKYKEIQKEINLAISISLKGKKIDEKYYSKFKFNIKKDFPEFIKILSTVEKEIKIARLKKFINKKKIEIKRVGQDEADLHKDLLTKALEAYIQEKKEIPSMIKVKNLINTIGREILPKFSEALTADLIKDRHAFLSDQRKLQKGFETRLYERWKDPLDLFECLIQISLESGEKRKKKLNNKKNNKNNSKYDALIKLHARALHISNEIAILLKSGYADGANARWRSLHELAVISFFLCENNNDASKRYLEHSVIRALKEAKDYRTYYKKLGYPPIKRKELLMLEKEAERLCKKYSDRFQDDYGWIPSSILKERNFKALAQSVKLDKLRPYYNLACDSSHGGSKGFYRLGLMDDSQDKIFLVGSSNYGLASPLQNSAISLLHVSSCLLTLEPDFESIIQIYVMDNFMNEICDKAVEVQNKIEKETD